MQGSRFRTARVLAPMDRVRDGAFWQCDLLFLPESWEGFRHPF